ncbi:ABC transporter permease subunit [Halopiger xanaduensis]|uniref:ABC-type transporter, integral membrane subunit n=1 Tax=Halopiger xanaduensis (strain DSM 18323 / JCM 14033 / SH-6) TaxID=797210 RepID=F8DCC8_HALXS|nr:ABC transporter permease subunit [Halopiger xanaduensis]AEH38386.1 ABC-type transporter, integral membrane subunit [Halopiger xanaduensis SH-6]
MTNWLIKRVGQSVLTVVVVFHLTFALVRLMPGNPFEAMVAQMLSENPNNPAAARRLVEIYININPDAPMYEQYLDYMSSMLQGDLGYSMSQQESVNQILAEAVPWTIFYMSIAMVVTFTTSICLGAIMAYYEGSKFDTAMTVVAVVESSTPYYVVALLMSFVFAYQLGWFPTNSRYPGAAEIGLNGEFVFGALHHAALPILSLIVTGAAASLSMRGNSISVLGADHIRVARLRGLPPTRIALRYVMRNAILPLYTGLLLLLGFMIGGSIILEDIFQYRGMGWYMYEGVQNRDYPLMVGGFMVICITVVIMMFIADLTYSRLDPRAKTGGDDMEVYGSAAGVPIRTQIKRYIKRLTNSSEKRADGGTTTHGFFGEEDVIDVDRKDVLYRKFDRSFYAPAKIVLSDWRGLLGTAILAGFVLIALFGERFVPSPTATFDRWVSPLDFNPAHPLGTTNGGQDLLSLMVHGTSPVLIMITVGAFATVTLGVSIGATAGFRGGNTDRLLMTLCDIIVSVPGLPLIIVIAAIVEPRHPAMVGLVLSVAAWGGLGRSIRSEVLKVRSQEYVEASRAMGVNTFSIILKDILPNIWPYILINLANNARNIIFSSVGLYFLGFLPRSTRNWGVVLDAAQSNNALYSVGQIHYIAVPAVFIIALSMGLILVSQSLDRISNPRIRARHAKSVDEEEPV